MFFITKQVPCPIHLCEWPQNKCYFVASYEDTKNPLIVDL